MWCARPGLYVGFSMAQLTVAEICIGAGGQAIGLEQAGFEHVYGIDIDRHAVSTVLLNRPSWKVQLGDVNEMVGRNLEGIDLLAGGIPCPPFSIAGKQLGHDDERDLFPAYLRILALARPKAFLIENVPGFASSKFDSYRSRILMNAADLGYAIEWRVLNSADYGVPQLRPRFICVGIRKDLHTEFQWPVPLSQRAGVGETIGGLMASRGWPGAEDWKNGASGIAPTLVGGSKKHGGADLGPTRARQKWLELGVDGRGVADEPPGDWLPKDHVPRLTTQMAARIQGFPDSWKFSGGKTAVYKQIGNAFPPPVARAVGKEICRALSGANTTLTLPSLESVFG